MRSPGRREGCGQLLRFVLLSAALSWCSAASSDEGFAVHAVRFAESERGFALHADLSAGREDLIRQLLQSGYAVKLDFEAHLHQTRDWLPDKDLGTIRWNPEITYDSLLSRYTFRSGDSVEEFDSIEETLERAGKLRASPSNEPGIEETLTLPGLYLDVRFQMEIGHLPHPLQVSLLAGDWDISSGWRRIVINP